MFIIGELINCTRKRIRAAAEGRDTAYIKEVAVKQADAGASMLDVNGGGIAAQEAECLSWLVNVVQEAVELPLCLDSSDPGALRSALPLCQQRPLINSIPDEQARFEAVLPLLKEYRAKVIALCMAESGLPAGVEDRLATAFRLVDRLTAEGLALDDIYVDSACCP
jgi:cobalamin-dependent methionine synthase I